MPRAPEARQEPMAERQGSCEVNISEPNWVPLERFAELATKAGQPLHPGDFMHMGSAGPVELYKHCDTRRYLNLSPGGTAYRYDPTDNGYHPYDNPVDAIEHVLS